MIPMLLKRRMAKNGKKGFTLIELIVVIAILAVLMALLVPMIGKYIKDAQNTTNLANARAVYSAAAAYVAAEMAKNDGKVPQTNPTDTDLQPYFGNTNGKKITAEINKSTGAIIRATYDGVEYKPTN